MFNSSIMIVLLQLWAIKAPLNTGLNGASPKLLFCVYFCLTSAPIERGAGLFPAFWRRQKLQRPGGAAAFGGPGAFGPRASQTKGGAGPERAPPPFVRALRARRPPGPLELPPTFRAIDSLRPTDRRRSVRRRPQRHPGNFPPLGLGRGVEGSRFRGGAQRPLGTAREQSPNAGAEKRRQNTLPALRLSKKWLAPLFRGFHSSLAPTARPGRLCRETLATQGFLRICRTCRQIR